MLRHQFSPTAAVIIPAYNAARYLSECLDSLRKQTYSNFVAIIVDDGSADSTADIVKRIAAEDPRFILIEKPNGGVSSARNAGLDWVSENIPSTEFLGFVDADDYVSTDYLKIFVRALSERSLDYAVCAFTPFTKFGPVQRKLAGDNRPLAADDIAAQFFCLDNQSHPIPKTANTSLFLSNRFFRWGKISSCRFNTQLKAIEDQDFLTRAMPHLLKGIAIPENLYFYRKRCSSLSNAAKAKAHDLEGYSLLMADLAQFSETIQRGIINNYVSYAQQETLALLASGASTSSEPITAIQKSCLSLADHPFLSDVSKRKLRRITNISTSTVLKAKCRNVVKHLRMLTNRIRYFR